jgi:hopanoid biosynthesis associated radical SAM protein HpnH
MLEPLHACNLACAGCGRIREYADTMRERLSVEQCLAATDECGAPIVSVCGGEPLIYPEIELLIACLIEQRKHVYLCTNGVLLAKKLRGLRPSSRLLVNVHLDGMEATHDRMVEHSGAFAAAVRGILDAKTAGFNVCTNTTIYKDTDMHEVAVLFDYLYELGVGGFMISPAFGYASVRDADPGGATRIFMTRDEVHEKFRSARGLQDRFRLTASPIYLEFLRGERTLDCAAWANPTYNVRGWRGPCYLLGDAHYRTYREFRLHECTGLSGVGGLYVQPDWGEREYAAWGDLFDGGASYGAEADLCRAAEFSWRAAVFELVLGCRDLGSADGVWGWLAGMERFVLWSAEYEYGD